MVNIVLAYWHHTLDPFLVRFPKDWGIDGIRWYGVAYLLSFFLAYKLLNFFHTSQRIVFPLQKQQNFLFALFCGILLGGRLGYAILYAPQYYLQKPLEIFQIWQGGMAFHGAIIGIFISLLWFSKANHYNLLSLTDLTIPLGTLGIFFGRIANFINGEVYGRYTEVPWGVIFGYDLSPRHPSQLYEAFFEGLILFIFSFSWIYKGYKQQTPGTLTCLFLVFYGMFRFLVEFVREPDAPLIFFFTRGQFYSIIMLCLGILGLFYVKVKNRMADGNIFCR